MSERVVSALQRVRSTIVVSEREPNRLPVASTGLRVIDTSLPADVVPM